MWLWYVLCPRAVKFITHAPLYLFPFSFLNEPPYLLRLPSISVISGIKLANIAYNTTTNVVRHQHGQTDHTHTHTHTRHVYLLPCSFLYEPPYLLRVPRMSMISGMKLANIAWRPRETAKRRYSGQGGPSSSLLSPETNKLTRQLFTRNKRYSGTLYQDCQH